MNKHNSRVALALFVLGAAGVDVRVANADVVTDFNAVLLDAVRTGGSPPPRASRAMAMVSLSVYEAVNSIDRGCVPYLSYIQAPQGASQEAAAAQAARDALVALYPAQQATFDSALATHLAAIPDGPGKSAGIAVGQSAAASILANRANDHSSDVVPYTPGSLPGQWRPTPPANAPALLPNWPTVTPFALQSGSQFRPSGPPSLTSDQYTTAFNQVKELGAANSATRTPEQTNIARFWADGGGTSTPPGHWNRIASSVAIQRGNSVVENARMFALLNMGTADAGIAAWDAKYATNFWRPITAIREADTDGNANTLADIAWTPLLTTPNFPTYVSGHSTFSAASAYILAQVFGTDSITFTSTSEGFAVPDRTFTSFSQAAEEAGMSRIYGGIHFAFDNTDGLALGTSIGTYVYSNYLEPVPTPGAGVLLVLGGLVAGRRRR